MALPHMPVLTANSQCAFTQKCRRWSWMLASLGYDIVTYGAGPDFDGAGTYVECGDGDVPMSFDPTEPGWKAFNDRAIAEIGKNPDGILCLIAGRAQQPIAEAFPDMLCIEWGVGYGGVFADFCAFESYAWMHTVYGSQTFGDAHQADGRFYDTVIPNSYHPEEFPEGEGEGGYALFVGRLIERKGVQVTVEACERAGVRLLVAGDGDFRPPGEHVTYLGPVGPGTRAGLMGAASVLLAPTLYVEPFGGVAVEAQLCGTPVVSTDWGAFTETVDPAFRCRTLAQFADAISRAQDVDRKAVRERAMARWTCDVVRHSYAAWLQAVASTRGEGWYGS